MSTIPNDQNLPARAPTPQTAMRIATPQGGAMQPYQQPARKRFENAEEGDVIMPRLHLIQGLPKEGELYGEHFKKGDWVNTLTSEKIDPLAFIPVIGWNQYIKWKLGSDGKPSNIPLLNTRDRSQFTKKELDFDEVTGAKPAVSQFMNFLVVVEGSEMPLVLTFKSTSLKSGRSLNGLEISRGARGPGLYTIDLRDQSNAKGKWKHPVVRPIGDPSRELAQFAADIFNSYTPDSIKVELPPDENDGGSGDGSGDVPAGGVEFNPDKL
jgi:hypothetical protein